MKSLRSRLPPPNALVVFEAVARRLSFTGAARELKVSQAATSRQIANLESHLGVALFHRVRRRVSLTEAGEQFRVAVDLGLNHIASAADGLRQRAAEPGGLRVATTIAFSTYWLLPRLAGFHAAHPGFELNLITSDSPRDWAAEGVPLAIQFGGPDWPGYRVERLFGDEILAVARPSLFEGRQAPCEPVALLAETLLHMDSELALWADWPAWLERCGVTVPGRLPGPHFTTYTITIQAALEGRGVALGWRRLLAPELEAGRLIGVTEARVDPEDFYRLFTADAMRSDPAVQAFRTWLLDEAAADWR